MSDFKLSSRSVARLLGVHIDLLDVAARAIQITKVDFGIPETGGRRTPNEQHQLYRTVNNMKGPDGYEVIGKHQKGEAIDFYAIDPETNKASWDEVLLAQVACAFFQAAIELGVKIRWGGLFTSWTDMPHIELIGD